MTKEQYFEILFRRKELLNILIKSSKKFLESTILEKTQEKNLECLCDVSTQHQSTSNKRKCLNKDRNIKRNKNNFDDTINTSKNKSSYLTEDDKSKAVNHIKNVVSNYIIKFLQSIDYDEAKKSQTLSNLDNISIEIKKIKLLCKLHRVLLFF